MSANEVLKNRRKALTAQGRVQVTIGTAGIETATPYNQRFVDGARRMNGRWCKERYCWVFPLARKQDVLLFLKTIYGKQDSQFRRSEHDRPIL